MGTYMVMMGSPTNMQDALASTYINPYIVAGVQASKTQFALCIPN